MPEPTKRKMPPKATPKKPAKAKTSEKRAQKRQSKHQTGKEKISVTLEESATLKHKILDAFLARSGDEGWTEATLIAAAEDVGENATTVWALFPEKEKDALATWSRFLDVQTEEKLKELNLSTMKIRERIFWAVRTRLTLLAPHKKAASKAFRFLLRPNHTAMGVPLIYETVHTMWSMAGDTSTDYNFYTKRFLLSGVYTATFLYWLKDTSPEHHKTWKFLEARIENVLALQKVKSLTALSDIPLSIAKKWAERLWPFR